MKERDWQRTILEAARYLNWHVYHTFDSRRSAAGFPDLLLIKPPRLLVIEVKTERGRVTAAQESWLALFAALPGVTALVARPSDWPAVEAVLKGDEVCPQNANPGGATPRTLPCGHSGP